MSSNQTKFVLLLLGIFTLNLAAFAQRDTIPVNTGWSFLIDKEGKGLSQRWFSAPLSRSREVTLPHTWNVEAKNEKHYGWGWYQNNISAPKSWKGKNIVLELGAVNHTAIIYLNGKKIHENIGDGFNKIYVDLSDKLRYAATNIITVAVNNDYGRNKVPFGESFDWPNDGGLIRKVKLIVSGRPAASYLHAEPVLVIQDESAKLKLKLGFAQSKRLNIKLEVKITEENQPSKDVILSQISEPKWENGEAVVDYSLPKVNPWHFDHPNLYRVDVTVMVGNQKVDKISANIGFRDLRFVKGQTFINGERVKLMGAEWTAGSNPDFGFAETDEEILRHCKLLKEVNTIFTRIHFQQDDLFYDFCNRAGILVQAEVPLWGPDTPVNDTIRSIATKQLERMIRDQYNHPSIFAWGVGNELRGRNPEMKTMIENLVSKSRLLDPGRKVAYVSNTLKDGFYNNPAFVPDAGSIGDYLMMNEYSASWWKIPQAKLSGYLDSIHLSYPEKPFFISEFGLCGPNFKGGDERRVEDLIYHMAVYETKPYIEGAIYFDLTDYRTHYPGTYDEGKMRRRVHGVFDMYGKAKPSAKVLRELSSPVEVQRLEKRGNKLVVSIFGSLGLPQHTVRGYKLYLSDKNENFLSFKSYDLPDIKPGELCEIEVEDLFNGKGIITVVKPAGYIASQKQFYE